jgi:hypothetical protein
MSETIEIPESPRSTVIGVTFRIMCNKCGFVWNIYMEESAPPDLWDACKSCLSVITSKGNDVSTENKNVYKCTKILAKYPFLTNGYTGETYKG